MSELQRLREREAVNAKLKRMLTEANATMQKANPEGLA